MTSQARQEFRRAWRRIEYRALVKLAGAVVEAAPDDWTAPTFDPDHARRDDEIIDRYLAAHGLDLVRSDPAELRAVLGLR